MRARLCASALTADCWNLIGRLKDDKVRAMGVRALLKTCPPEISQRALRRACLSA